MNINKRIGGKKAQRSGKAFERMVKLCAERQGLTAVIIEDGAKRVGMGGNKTEFLRQDLDMILFKGSNAIFLDCKSRNTKSITKSGLLVNSKSTRHQLDRLFRINQKHGFTAGFLVQLKKSNRIVWCDAKDVYFAEKEIPYLDITMTPNALPDFEKLFSFKCRLKQ